MLICQRSTVFLDSGDIRAKSENCSPRNDIRLIFVQPRKIFTSLLYFTTMPVARRACRDGNLSIDHFIASVAETPFEGVKDSGCGREGGPIGWHRLVHD
jgi:hypothetical protein